MDNITVGKGSCVPGTVLLAVGNFPSNGNDSRLLLWASLRVAVFCVQSNLNWGRWFLLQLEKKEDSNEHNPLLFNVFQNWENSWTRNNIFFYFVMVKARQLLKITIPRKSRLTHRNHHYFRSREIHLCLSMVSMIRLVFRGKYQISRNRSEKLQKLCRLYS